MTVQSVQVKLVKLGKNFVEFDLIGVAPSIANAVRRSVISEVPTMAIDKVHIVNNTSIIPDEVLAHRLGLVPIHVDPRKFDFVSGDLTDVNTIVLELHEKCSPIVGKPPDAPLEERFSNTSVLSRSIKWVPQGSQAEVFVDDPIRPSHDDILLLKLRSGQEVELELHCCKGIGKDHAKWSPVSCASYRLLPSITITAPITGADAQKFVECFPKSVIEIEKSKGVETAIVRNPRKDTVSRECLRHPEFSDKVILSLQIETVGFYGPVDVVKESLQILAEKCARLRNSLHHL